jgi:hypothetical protein
MRGREKKCLENLGGDMEKDEKNIGNWDNDATGVRC